MLGVGPFPVSATRGAVDAESGHPTTAWMGSSVVRLGLGPGPATRVRITSPLAELAAYGRVVGDVAGVWHNGRLYPSGRALLPGRHAYIESRLPAWSPPGLAVLTHQKQETPQPWPSRFV